MEESGWCVKVGKNLSERSGDNNRLQRIQNRANG